MLPYSTTQRKARDISRGRLDGRSTEIQRLIGRSLRAVVDLSKLDGFTVWIDCDVLRADGGTRTASITGACIASELAFRKLIAAKKISAPPLRKKVAAISAGVFQGTPCLDLDYREDKEASVDFNFVLTEDLEYVEVQGSGEEATFSQEELDAMLALSREGVLALCRIQEEALKSAAEVREGSQGLLDRVNAPG
jgi:ribonuclease PH